MGKKGKYSYKLEDVQYWNASNLAPALAPSRVDDSNELLLFDSEDTDLGGAEQPLVVSRPVRNKHAPFWAKD